jgi:transposase
LTRQQIYTWRREMRLKGMLLPTRGAVFLPVETASLESVTRTGLGDDVAASGVVELRLGNGRSLRFDSVLDTNTLTRLIRAVEAA